MKRVFPTEHVVRGIPVTMEAFVGLMIFALPIVFIGFTVYHFATKKKRQEEERLRKEQSRRYGTYEPRTK